MIFEIASEYGFASWSKLKSHVKTLEVACSTAEAVATLRDAAGRGELARLNALLHAHPELTDECGGGRENAAHQAVFGNSEAAVKLGIVECCQEVAAFSVKAPESRQSSSGGVLPGKNPGQGFIEAAKDANSSFTE